ncbi:MAG: hypothetical protein ACLR0U_12855 [Enterocloster clostridioformis]
MERVLKDYAPDAIFVEPSGVGRLSDIIEICLKQEDRGLHPSEEDNNRGGYPVL